MPIIGERQLVSSARFVGRVVVFVLAAALGGCSASSDPSDVAGTGQGVTADAGPSFPQCPAVGADTSCAILLVTEADGSLRVKADPRQGPFDGIEDTLIGVQNNSTRSILSIPLRGQTDIFGFDGDGLCAPFYTPRPSGCPFGPTGYEGPGVSFSSINANATAGIVSFAGGIPPGGSAYFSLEEAIQTQCPAVSNVPLLQQFDSRWACDIYANESPTELASEPKCTGGSKNLQLCAIDADCPGAGAFCCKKENTIRRRGCHLTAAAMVINHHAAVQGTGFSTTSALLNTWLAQHGGFDKKGGPLPSSVVQYANQNGVRLSYQGYVGNRDDFVVDQYICNDDPVILRVHGPHQHFVMATGQTTVGGVETYTVNDPGHGNVSTLAPYAFTYDGIRLYSSTPTPPTALYVRGHSPIELVLTDPDGRSTGLDPGQAAQQDIPASAYSLQAIGDDEDLDSGDATPEVKDLEVVGPMPGRYVLRVIGTGAGPFTIEIFAYNSNGDQARVEVSGNATLGSSAIYDIDFAPQLPVPGSLVVTPRNRAPDCTLARGSQTQLWPPNHKLVPISIAGVTDADSDAVRITITAITQDEPVGNGRGGDECPDGSGIGTASAQLRAERDASGDGRVYHLSFAADDGHGGQCTGVARVCVPHDQGQGASCGDQGPLANSTSPCSALQ